MSVESASAALRWMVGIVAAVEVVDRAPKHADRLQHSWDQLIELAKQSGLPLPENLGSPEDLQKRLGGLATSAAKVAWEMVSGLVLVLFLVLLMLLEAPAWRRNARRAWGRSGSLAAMVTGIAEKVRQYLFVRTVLGAASAGSAAVWLLLLDVDLVLVWVVLTFLLNYIPNIGSIIAVIPPSLMAFVQHGPIRGAIVLGGLAVIEQIIGNYIDPRMQGRRLQISPVVVLMALVFWTWMWGPVGALLAVPMTVTLLAAAAHVDALKALVTFLTGEESETVVREPSDGR